MPVTQVMTAFDPKQKYMTDRYQEGGGLTPIRICTCGEWPMGRKSLHHRLLWDNVHDH